MIRFENVTKQYGKDIPAVEDISFNVAKGEFVSLVGHSGAGKSTLLKLLIVEDRPSSGEVFLDDVNVNKVSPAQLPKIRRKVGAIFQDFRLLPDRNAWENIAFALEVSGASSKDINSIVSQVLKLVGLEDKAKKFPKQLSGGEKQRVAIARALVHNPDVIVADEPTGNLDPVTSWDIIRLLARINELGGTSIILATHDREIVNALERRVITLDHGRLIRDEIKGRYVL
ncbi:MAG: Cell division ATP-binding protein FtsE [Parcubacteria group bacterium GW2011_GWA2_40_8]|uniref:Cell division ATP-binding protein FtsE n=1 Tax=Candidatus Terrybacteria bacterium RIFCSPLOWO2_01_FULL_40_23 TaxID=1802366 RepID=A0A1G2PT32_9BACT|nr:MAG: Cell division ATP-binding protein FtsE [Parcubacteria group bacterium GW2011_GWB1_40_14]KKR77776.1 MAG: Cell division ATP-binding protein FtsE [Parcubacteria group bacterium GW2011_GWA2_40_8]OHA51484.1 MAG: cell division ATP-binding protein FtsE [Candidatus Terrybacteria bacterium RIFCSPLOWO2_01_FULL_40_23]